MFPLFQSPGTPPLDCHEFSEMESGLAPTAGARSHQVPLIDVCSSSSGGHQSGLFLQWEGLCSPSPHPSVHPLETFNEVLYFLLLPRIEQQISLTGMPFQLPLCWLPQGGEDEGGSSQQVLANGNH